MTSLVGTGGLDGNGNRRLWQIQHLFSVFFFFVFLHGRYFASQ